MSRFTALALSVALAVSANAQSKKVMVPSQSSNPNLIITPAPKDTEDLAKAKRIGRDEATKLANEGKAVFVDVRSRSSYDAGHIKGAISMPGSQMLARMRELPQGKMLITYCACVEEHTAARAVLQLNAHGIKNAAALVGGWNQWAALGLPIESNIARK